MKSKYIKKKAVRSLKWGTTQTLLDIFEESIDLFNEDKYDLGYRACMDDLAVRSQRLAEVIMDYQARVRVHTNEELAKVIESYYKQALDNE